MRIEWHGDVGCQDLPEGRELMMMKENIHKSVILRENYK